MTETFPSIDQYRMLKQKISKDGHESLSPNEKLFNRSYNYAWQELAARRPWPTNNDPLYDPIMVKAVIAMFSRRNQQRFRVVSTAPTTEQLAHVEQCVRLSRIYLDHGDQRRRAAFDGLPISPPLPLIETEWMTAQHIADAIVAMTKV